MMAPPGRHAIPGAGNGHLGELQDAVIGRRKPAVYREPRKRGVLEIPFDHGAEAV